MLFKLIYEQVYAGNVEDQLLRSDFNILRRFYSSSPPAFRSFRNFILLATFAALFYSVSRMLKASDEQKLLNFLQGFLIQSTDKMFEKHQKHYFPVSYSVGTEYPIWVCTAIANCTPGSPEALEFLQERILQEKGVSLADGALWQMALARHGLRIYAQRQTELLGHGTTAAGVSTLHAKSPPYLYGLNQSRIPDTYFFETFPPDYSVRIPDPLASWESIPSYSTADWPTFRPTTGQNIWGAIIGPLQTAYYLYHRNISTIPLTDPALQMARNLLVPLKAMQSPLGALYHVPHNTRESIFRNQINHYTVYLKDNFLALAGLDMLRSILEHKQTQSPDDLTIARDLAVISDLVRGILKFCRDYGYNAKSPGFYQGGLLLDPKVPQAWMPFQQPYSVTTQLSGLSVLGLSQLQNWTASNADWVTQIWQSVKEQAGYYGITDNQLQGVGLCNEPIPITTESIQIKATNYFSTRYPEWNSTYVVAIWQNDDISILTPDPIEVGKTKEITVPMKSMASQDDSSPLRALRFLNLDMWTLATVPVSKLSDGAEIFLEKFGTSGSSFARVVPTRYEPRHDILVAAPTFAAANMAFMMVDQYQSIGQTQQAQLFLNDAESLVTGVEQLLWSRFSSQQVPASAVPGAPVDQDAYLAANQRINSACGELAAPIPATGASAWKLLVNAKFNPYRLGGERTPVNWQRYQENQDPVGTTREVNDDSMARVLGRNMAVTFHPSVKPSSSEITNDQHSHSVLKA